MPLHASDGTIGNPMELEGGAPVTTIDIDEHVVFPQASSMRE